MKISKIIIGILIILIVGICVILTVDRSKYLNENKDLKSDLIKVKGELENLKNELNTKNNEEYKTCTYTQTYRFIENYDYMGAVPSKRFIIVDAFQEFIPIIFEYDINEFNINFEKDSYYEFTFEGNVYGNEDVGKHIKNIVKTDKIGLEQIQEECEVR